MGHDGTNLRTDLPGRYEVRCAGNLLMEHEGPHLFYLRAPHPVFDLQLHRAQQQIFQGQRDVFPGQELVAKTYREAGRIYPVNILYRTDAAPAAGDMGLELLWSGPSGVKQPIPHGNLGSGVENAYQR
ncbi:MAG: hypothetical protein ACUVWX_06600 [Kiritimatiellia bacterium]